jgi:hypothetical protein
VAVKNDELDVIQTTPEVEEASAGAETKAGDATPTADDKPPQANRPNTGRAAKPPKETARSWVYIGPSIPRTALTENGVTKGTRTAVEEHFRAVLEKHPAAKRLIVPIEELPEARAKVHASGNVLSKTYADITAAIKS